MKIMKHTFEITINDYVNLDANEYESIIIEALEKYGYALDDINIVKSEEVDEEFQRVYL